MGKVLPFARRVAPRPSERPLADCAVTIEARRGAVTFGIGSVEAVMSSDQARELARNLVEASLDADQAAP